MSSSRKGVRIAVAGALTTLAALIPAGSASATTLNGAWAPFTRCPVDDPSMLAADGVATTATCLSSHSPNGSIKLGSTRATTGVSDLQLGVLTSTGSKFALVSPSSGGILGDPVKIPGGLLGLMCPSNVPLISQLCELATDNDLNNVFATVEPAGQPTNFDLSAGLSVGKPILSLPVKVHLRNPLLASTCTIGSNANPIVLKPKNLAAPTGGFTRFDGNGTTNPTGGVMFRIGLTGAAQGDDSFAVPSATGCGGLGLLDIAINLKTGLPSPAGNNSLVLNDASTFIAGLNNPSAAAPDNGKDLAAFWHSAVQP